MNATIRAPAASGGFDGCMAEVHSTTQRQRRGTLSWHLGASSVDQAIRFSSGPMSVVLSGTEGLRVARQLRAANYTTDLRVDPLGYETKPPSEEGALFRLEADWAEMQREAGVTELLSPGVYVPEGDADLLAAALEGQQEWAAGAVGATLQIAIHWRWLADDCEALIAALDNTDSKVALLLADSNDPLSKAGAVEGLASVVAAHPDIALHRCDLGGLGAVALGGRHGVVGIGTSLRHVVPPDKKAGGRPGDRSPSVFIPELLSFLKGSRLAGLAASDSKGRFSCELPGCDGRPYRTFRDPASETDALVHNQHSVEQVVAKVLAEGSGRRFAMFRELCENAIVAASQLSGELHQDVAVSPQLASWATL